VFDAENAELRGPVIILRGTSTSAARKVPPLATTTSPRETSRRDNVTPVRCERGHMLYVARAFKWLPMFIAVAVVATFSLVNIAIPAAQAASKASVVGVLNGPFGPMIVAGSGSSAGTALYFITSDHGSTYGCTATKQSVEGQPYVCTGPPSSQHADWPAYTTTRAPIAGPGIKQSLLGEVNRAGIGEQVTYAGHPLYLFDEVPGIPTGENWDEPSIPADHGMWWLLSPSGVPIGSEGVLSTVTIKGHQYLGTQVIDAGGVVVVPVYSYSGGAACTGECAAAFPPLYAQGSPGLTSTLTQKGGLVTRADGSQQRTWDGHALYVFGSEGLSVGATGVNVAGNGNGVKESGGTFTLVTP
jgi:predicted lipoprotein with Yx(FWY)xxD motif